MNRLVSACVLLLTVLALFAPPRSASAADRAGKGKNTQGSLDHPSVKVVLAYLDYALKRDWKNSTVLIEPDSLLAVRRDFVRKVKSAPTMDDEFELIGSVGKRNIKEVEEMDPKAFYAAYHKALQKRFKLTAARIQQIADTIDLRVLSVAVENDDLVHVLVRTKHQTDEAEISNLELLSLVRIKGKWFVSLNQRGTMVTPLEETKAKAKAASKSKKKK